MKERYFLITYGMNTRLTSDEYEKRKKHVRNIRTYFHIKLISKIIYTHIHNINGVGGIYIHLLYDNMHIYHYQHTFLFHYRHPNDSRVIQNMKDPKNNERKMQLSALV